MASTPQASHIKIFHDIHNYIEREYDLALDKETPRRRKFEEEKAKHGCMKNYNYGDYIMYWGQRALEAVRSDIASRKAYTARELFNKLQHHPLNNHDECNRLSDFINQSYFPANIELGKLNGETRLRLAPRQGLFDEDTDVFGNLSHANHLAAAVSYEEGHPSEFAYRLITPRRDAILRRFWEVGHIIMQTSCGSWEMSGHVMVMDLDRDRRPWLILAKTWSTDDDEAREMEAPDTVMKDDSDALGVFPGNNNRTTIAMMTPLQQSTAPHSPLLLQMGVDFEFGLQRSGKAISKAAQRSPYGPSLAKVMTWFKRPNGQEVCFDENRKEYMTRNPSTGNYSYPNPGIGAFGQQVGNLSLRESQYVPLSARPGGPSSGPSGPSRRPQAPTSSSTWE
ncbi:MAG: hypothetical protein Q9170_003950 [Blastenia crenularia]